MMRAFLGTVVAIVIVLSVALSIRAMIACGWSSLWLGKAAVTAWLMGYCS